MTRGGRRWIPRADERDEALVLWIIYEIRTRLYATMPENLLSLYHFPMLIATIQYTTNLFYYVKHYYFDAQFYGLKKIKNYVLN